jgi:DNA-binding beta-propeller fold protein YncE
MLKQIFGSGEFRYEVVDNWAKRPRAWPFTDVVGVGIDSRDRVYVFNRSPHPVMVFDKEGNFVRSWGEGIFLRPHGVFIDPDDAIWCTDDNGHTVRKFDTSGNLLLTIGYPGAPIVETYDWNKHSDTGYDGRDFHTIKRAGPPFNRPTKAVIAPSGELYVSDGYGNARVHKFSKDGKLLYSWGEPGSGPGQFAIPHSVAVDKQGRVYVADRENRRIQVFNEEGTLITAWSDVRRPDDMVIVDDQYLFVAELLHRVSIWTLEGQLLAHWGDEKASNDTGLFISPHAIAVDSRGVLYVGEVCDTNARYDRGSRAIQKFIPVR